ncbi:MAG: putative rane protein [Haloplasmataceae bacterium]|jgi:uncharacterized membrane protein YhhN|nr:putative rane protein [Haloplasmataceae bacterium]
MLYLIPFLLISFLNIYFEFTRNIKGRIITKPLLMPLLILFYIGNVSVINYLVILALICGLLGDISLLWSERKSFVTAGISAFLNGHIFYIIIFLQSSAYLKELPLWLLTLFIPYIVLGVIAGSILFPVMKTMKMEATIYMGVIFIMSYMSLTQVFSIPFDSFLFTFIGSVFFVTSDLILAFDMFKKHNQKNNLYVMITYICAQLFIITGLIFK